MKQFNQFKKQSGFAMLEVVLAIVIIAIASFGIYKLYSSSSTNSKLSGEENLVSQIYNQATQMASVTGSQPTAAQLSDSGAFDADISSATNGVFKSQFGNVTYAGKTTYASIAAEKIPGSVVDQFAAHMQKWGDVYTTEKDGKESAYPAGSYTASKLYTVTVYFPKGRCELAGDCQ